MKSCIVFALFVALAVAVPVYDDATITKYEYQPNIGDGSYQFGSETSDGKTASEEGKLVNVGTENEGISVRGQFSYVGPDGITYTVNYTADENGFRPEGRHIPVA